MDNNQELIEALKREAAALRELLAVKDQLITELKARPATTITYLYPQYYPYYQYQYNPYFYRHGAGGGNQYVGGIQPYVGGGAGGGINLGGAGGTGGQGIGGNSMTVIGDGSGSAGCVTLSNDGAIIDGCTTSKMPSGNYAFTSAIRNM